ncbi:MAG: adenylyltransferase/cytidyltransferase family protein [Chthoniobacterales bacterium]
MKNEKVVSIEKLAGIAHAMAAEGRRLVVTNGCFDLLHVGHVRYLESARELGDALAVGLNGDVAVRELKGADRPLNREQDRAEVIAALACINYVAVFQEMRATRFLETVRPAIYVKGGDYQLETLDPEEREALEKVGAEIRIIPFEADYSTSSLIARMHRT